VERRAGPKRFGGHERERKYAKRGKRLEHGRVQRTSQQGPRSA
jgi:hypothetical protein